MSNDNNSQSSSASRIIIPATAAAGQLVITQPAQSSTSYYKIAPSNPVTFAWSFTYLLATPTSLQVSAACGENTYPVGPTDGIIPGTATEVIWDMYEYQRSNPQTPLPQAMCTLMIADTAPNRGFGSRQKGGYLSPNTGLQFALYTPQPYTPIAEGRFSLNKKECYTLLTICSTSFT